MKVRKRISAILMSMFILFSSTLVPFYNAEHVYAGAFVPVLEYGMLEVLEWIFLACGVTVSLSAVHDSGLGDEIVDEIADSFQLWYTANGFDTFGEDVKSIFLECLAGGVAGTISVSQDLWSLIKGFAGSLAKGDVTLQKTGDVSIDKILDERVYSQGLTLSPEALTALNDCISTYGTKYVSVVQNFQNSAKNYTWPNEIIFLFSSYPQPFNSYSASNNEFRVYLNGSIYFADYPATHALVLRLSSGYTYFKKFFSSDYEAGNSWFLSLGYGTYSYCSPILFNGQSSQYSEILMQCSAISNTQGLLLSGNYDVLSKGQTAVGAGDVTITIPEEISVSIDGINSKLDSIEKALEKIQAGSITAGDVLDDSGVYPVDVVAGESVYEYEDEDGNSAVIPLEQVLARLDELAKEDVQDSEAEEDTESDLILNDPGIPTPAVLPEGITDMLNTLKSKFPFCIPFDMVAFVKNFQSNSPKDDAPVFTVSIPMPFVNYVWEIKVDLSDYWEYVKIFRFGLLATFIIGLMFSTRKLISWQLPS